MVLRGFPDPVQNRSGTTKSTSRVSVTPPLIPRRRARHTPCLTRRDEEVGEKSVGGRGPTSTLRSGVVTDYEVEVVLGNKL